MSTIYESDEASPSVVDGDVEIRSASVVVVPVSIDGRYYGDPTPTLADRDKDLVGFFVPAPITQKQVLLNYNFDVTRTGGTDPNTDSVLVNGVVKAGLSIVVKIESKLKETTDPYSDVLDGYLALSGLDGVPDGDNVVENTLTVADDCPAGVYKVRVTVKIKQKALETRSRCVTRFAFFVKDGKPRPLNNP